MKVKNVLPRRWSESLSQIITSWFINRRREGGPVRRPGLVVAWDCIVGLKNLGGAIDQGAGTVGFDSAPELLVLEVVE